MLRHGRMRFNKEIFLFTRKQGIKPIICSLKRNIMFYMLPDIDFGIRNTVFTSFFGHPASTLTAPASITAATHATVIPVMASLMYDCKASSIHRGKTFQAMILLQQPGT